MTGAESVTRAGECLDCGKRIEQDCESGIWLPLRCPECDATIESKGRELLQRDAEAWDRVMSREMMAATNLRAEIVDGRLTLDRLPELYAEARVDGGVSPERYREVATLVKDFISVPPLLRTSNMASILFLHGDACSIACSKTHKHALGKGTGKSWLLEAAIGHCARTLKFSAMFSMPVQIWAAIKDHDDQAKSEARVLRDMSTLDCLAIDDLARKTTPTEWEVSIILQIVDERQRLCRPTLISCNYDVKGFFELWADSNDPKKTKNVELLADRLADRKHAISMAMSGKSLRREK